MRAPGLTWFRLPLFVWSIYATSVVIMLATPVLAITLVLLMIERTLGVGIFDPKLGGDPVLYQHMFWFYSHPAVYIMILPAHGRDLGVRGRVHAQEDLRLQVRRVLIAGDRVPRLPGLGAPPLRRRHLRLLGDDLLVPDDARRRPLGHQGLQLDGDDVQGLSVLADADALRPRLHRPLHHRRRHGTLPRRARHRRPRARHLLRRRPLPLHHGRRHDHGLHGRPALLVAERSPAACIPSGGRVSPRCSCSSAST